MYQIEKDGKKSSFLVKKDINFLAEQLNAGCVISFPTDTVYGLACVFDRADAISKIKKIKGRDENKPLPMMVSDVHQLEGVAVVNENAHKIFRKFSPGAITLVLKKDENLLSFVTNGFDTIAIRIPKDDFILGLINKVNKPLLVTSANRSNLPAATTSQEVIDQIFDEIDFIVEGESESSVASTIVEVETCKILRQGSITEKEIMEVLK